MQPRLSQLNIWKIHEERVSEILSQALVMLSNEEGLIQDENDLNRQLYFCLNKANEYFYRLGRGLDNPLVYEAKNQPSISDKKKSLREEKRPDFQWGYVDHTELDPNKCAKWFCIECKRLGEAISSWVLNENYVHNGIYRFINKDCGYAMDVDSGAMVGYIESLDFENILDEINGTLAKSHPQIPLIMHLEDDWKVDNCNRLRHTFDRNYQNSPFLLIHFWIDVRGKLQPISKARNNHKIVTH